MSFLIDLFLHLDVHLNDLVTQLGPWFYGLLFLVIFCETGLVVTPLLPGDSLLFATGALAAIDGSPLSLPLLAAILFAAAICGDVTNYSIGRRLGPKVFHGETSRFLNRRYLDQTRAFYERHGGKTVVLARFVPIVRTFAPFVAGIGQMPMARYLSFCVTGALLWIIPFLLGGYFLGNVPGIKANFHLVIVAILVISVMPTVIQVVKARRGGASPVAAK